VGSTVVIIAVPIMVAIVRIIAMVPVGAIFLVPVRLCRVFTVIFSVVTTVGMSFNGATSGSE
jgi:hypothetical protein